MGKFSKILLIGGAVMFLFASTTQAQSVPPAQTFHIYEPTIPDMVDMVGIEYPYCTAQLFTKSYAPYSVAKANTTALRSYDPGWVNRI